MRVRSRKTWKFCEQFLRFFKPTPYGKIFKILFRKFSPPHRSTLFCSNFVKFIRRKVGEIMRYLPDQKTISAASQTVATARIARASSSPQQCAHNAPNFIQIGLLSAES